MSLENPGPAAPAAASSKCDLHAHSRFSDRPSEWYLDRIGAPESFTEPVDLYRVAKARGMDFVTVSDHDAIAGALELSHLPDVFVSSEVTVCFPEDGCTIHVLALGVTGAQHAEIQRRRSDLYAFREYVRAEGIVHVVAHPLFRVDDQLTLDHLEKLFVLFRRFEGANGTREPRASRILEAVLASLDTATVADMAQRQGLAFDGDVAYATTGGSDDHGGLYLATTWTETPPARDAAAFLAHIAAGRCQPRGEHGSSLKLARSFQTLAHEFYRAKVLGGARRRRDPFSDLLRRFAEGNVDPDRPEGFGWRDLARRFAPFAGAGGPLGAAGVAAELAPEPAAARGGSRRRIAESALAREAERRVFEAAARLGDRSFARSLESAVSALEGGDLLRAAASLPSGLAPALVAVSPYLAAFRFQHKDEPLVSAVAERFAAARPLSRLGARVAWATDTLEEVNGVAGMIRSVATLAARRELPLSVLAARRPEKRFEFEVENFTPIWETPLPGYDELTLSVPPALELLEHCEREGYGRFLISTPGPMGLAALAAARLLSRPTLAFYHTDFPRYASMLVGSDRLEGWARAYLGWFYRQMDRVLVASPAYAAELAALGVPAERLETLEHGVDAERFRPERRDPDFFARFELARRFTFLYVGRVSREKNLEYLLLAFRAARAAGLDAQLVVVGDGPARRELESGYAASDVRFTGYLSGDALAGAYASADAFAFPSRTDTFGNVVLEAMASGLPVIVAQDRGPGEWIRHGEDGLAIDFDRPGAFVEALELVARNAALRERLAAGGRETAVRRTWDRMLGTIFPTFRAPEVATREREAFDESLVAALL